MHSMYIVLGAGGTSEEQGHSQYVTYMAPVRGHNSLIDQEAK